jgi:energy-converting hydrogenase Eha subunit A
MSDKPVKSGWKTSEFWVTAITGIAITLNQSGVLGSIVLPIETIATIVAGVASYVLSRGLAKK